MATKRRYFTSDDLKKKLVMLEKDINKLQNLVEVTRKKLAHFLQHREPDEFTKSLYPNRIDFNPRSLVIHSERLNKLNREYTELKEQYINQLRKELISEFLAENNDLKSELKDIRIEKTESGTQARVTLK